MILNTVIKQLTLNKFIIIVALLISACGESDSDSKDVKQVNSTPIESPTSIKSTEDNTIIYEANRICEALGNTGDSLNCEVNSSNFSIDVIMNSTSTDLKIQSVETQTICSGIVNAVTKHTKAFDEKWKLRFFSPNNRKTLIAICNLNGTINQNNFGIKQPEQNSSVIQTNQQEVQSNNKKWTRNFGNGIISTIVTELCQIPEFTNQGYTYSISSSIPIARLKQKNDAWQISDDTATTVLGCWSKNNELIHAKLRRKKDGKTWEQDFKLDDGNWNLVSETDKASNVGFKLLTDVEKKPPSIGNCHMGSCSWAKPLSVRVVQKSEEQAILEVELLGGDSTHEDVENYPSTYEGVDIKWNKEPHKVVITCSYKHPTVSMDGQVDELPLNPRGVPDILISATNLYFQFCHSYDGNGIENFGYNVVE
jgi:hypothetical protein